MLERLREEVEARMREVLTPIFARLRAAVEPHLNQLRARYQKLEPRERILAKIAGGLGALVVAYNFLYLPIMGLRVGLNDQIAERQRDLSQVRGMVRTYLELKSEVATAHKRTVPSGKDFSLFSVVEKTLSQSVGRNKLGSITPAADKKVAGNLTEYRVDLQLTNLNLAQLVDALYGLKTLPVPVTVSNLRIKRRFQDPHSYDVDITCVALGKNS